MTTQNDQQKYPNRWCMADGGHVYRKRDEEVPTAVEDEFYEEDENSEGFELVDWQGRTFTGNATGGIPMKVKISTNDTTSWTHPTEVAVTDPVTGGKKNEKPEEYAYIPSQPLAEVARVYGQGAKKYEPWNWTKGYDWRLSFSALGRHIEAFRRGESHDPDSGLHHLAHATFHLFTLMEFERLQLGADDRWKS